MRIPIALAAILSLALASPVDKRQTTCATGVYMLIAQSHGDVSPPGYGLSATLVESVLSQIPGSSNYSISYPYTSSDVQTAVMAGVTTMTQTIEQYIQSCPDTPIVLIGYSEGAIVNSNTLCGRSVASAPTPTTPLPSQYTPNILAYIAYGDETFVSGLSFDHGTCTSGQGVDPRADPSGCDAWAPIIQSYCDSGDPECCGGTNSSAHFVYAQEYDGDATQFIVDQWNARQNK